MVRLGAKDAKMPNRPIFHARATQFNAASAQNPMTLRSQQPHKVRELQLPKLCLKVRAER